jgi:aspartate aminotransferase-like enzyme
LSVFVSAVPVLVRDRAVSLSLMSDTPFGTFFIPGPTEIRPELLSHMTRPVIGHRGKNFEGMFARIEAGLRDVFLTARPVYVGATSATGFMEMAIRNGDSQHA